MFVEGCVKRRKIFVSYSNQTLVHVEANNGGNRYKRGLSHLQEGGNKIVLTGPEIVMEKTDAPCANNLAFLLHYSISLREGTDPLKLSLSEDKDVAYIQCSDPGAVYGGRNRYI